MSKYSIDKNGYYGEFGGAFIPEILRKNVVELKDNYLKIIENEEFQKDFRKYIRNLKLLHCLLGQSVGLLLSEF